MRKYFRRGLIAALIVTASLVVAGVALGFDSGGNPGGPGPNTITWTGQGESGGTLNTVQCDAQNDPNGLNQPYEYWVFTTDGGSASNPTLHLGTTAGGNQLGDFSPDTATGSTFHFVTPYYTPDTSTLFAYADFTTVTAGNGSWNLVISHGCPGAPKDLTASKTATPSFSRTYTWGIKKEVDKTKVDIPSGGSVTSNYTVTITHDNGVDGGWQATGSITVNNPNPYDVSGVNVTDAIDNGGNCSVTGGSSATIPANSSSSFAYTCTYASAPSPSSFTNTATVTWNIGSPHTSTTATATGDFGSVSPTIIDGSAHVTDTNGQSWDVSYTDTSPIVETYSVTRDGVGGTCTTYDNTATFTTNTTQTTGSDSASVEICVGEDLTVSKTATPSYSLKYKWGITKAVDKTNVTLFTGTATFNYTVTAGHDSGTASNWVVTGTISVTNPNDWESITFNLADAIDNGGVCTIDGGGTSLVVPASSTVNPTYTCTYTSAPNPVSGTNTATATWDATTFSTPDGSADGTATADFGAVSPTIIDNCVSVSDPIDPNSPHKFCVGDPGDPSFSFMYSRTVPAPPLGTCVSYNNTATFTTNTTQTTGSASKTVTVCATNPALTPGYWKNHLSVAKFPQSLGNYVVNTQAKATAVFNAMNCSSTSSQNAIGCLAGHLLATEFNLANNSDICIVPVVTKTNNFLKGLVVDGVTGINYTGPSGTYNLTSAQRNEAIALKNKLDTYNNGGGC